MSMLLESTPAALILAAANAYQAVNPVAKAQFRSWQVEQLINEASAMLERCVDLKRTLDDLWAQWAQQELDSLKDAQDNELSKYEVQAQLDAHPLEEARAQRRALVDGRAKDAVPGFPYANFNSQDSLAGLGVQAVSMFTNKNGADAAPGGYAFAQAALNAIQYAEKVAAADRQIAFEELGKSRRERTRANATNIRNARADYVVSGPLDYKARIRKLSEELLAPYLLDARERCAAAFIGLRQIYGLPESEAPPILDLDTVERTAGWARRQMGFLAKCGHLDQGFSITLSLKGLGKTAALDKTVMFSIPLKLLERHQRVRLRGVSAFVQAAEGTVVRVEVKAPSEGRYLTESGNWSDSVKQATPSCVLGRVSTLSSPRVPEIGGSVSLMNISPIGIAGPNEQWQATVSSLPGQKPVIDDLILEFSLVGRPI